MYRGARGSQHGRGLRASDMRMIILCKTGLLRLGLGYSGVTGGGFSAPSLANNVHYAPGCTWLVNSH